MNGMVPGYYPTAAYGQIPPQPIPQQQYSQSQVNAFNALSMIPNVLNAMIASGQCTQQEAAYIQQILNSNPQQNQAFVNSVAQTFGDMPVSPQQIQQLVYNKMIAAITSLRAAANRMPAPAPAFGAGYGAAPMPMPQAFPQNISPSVATMMETYGAQQSPDPTGQMSPNMAPNQAGAVKVKTVPQPAAKVDVPERQPTNQPYNIVMPADDIPTPLWYTEDVVQKNVEPLGDRPFYGARVYKTYRLESPPTIMIRLDAWRVVEAQLDASGAFYEIEHEKQEQQRVSDMELISFDEVKLIEVPYLEAQNTFTEAKKMYTKEKSIAGALKVCRFLEGKGRFGQILIQILLKYFNQAASVNFVKYDPATGGIDRLSDIVDEKDLSRLLSDTNDPIFEVWKEHKECFQRALSVCMYSSFNRVFSAVTSGYMDLSKPDNRDWVLMKFYGEMNIRGGTTTVMAKTLTPQQEKDIQDKMQKYFCLRIERKLLVHSLDILNIGDRDFRLFPLPSGLGREIMANAYTHFGSIDLVDRTDPTQLMHPLKLGSLYGGTTVVRRMLD